MQNLADIAGANATVQIANPNIQARWVKFIVVGSGTVRIGDSTVTSSRGLPILAGNNGLDLPYDSALQSYSLAGLYAYIPTGTTLSVAYEPFGSAN